MQAAPTARSARQGAADRAELHGPARSGADTAATCLTLVTLDWRRFDIETSVGLANAAVYSPAVLRLRSQRLGRTGCEETRGWVSIRLTDIKRPDDSYPWHEADAIVAGVTIDDRQGELCHRDRRPSPHPGRGDGAYPEAAVQPCSRATRAPRLTKIVPVSQRMNRRGPGR
jgi:hypothetical protein